jgi:hypothetical protein
LIAASQEIASSTAQMVVASKVKAKKESANLAALSSASKKVGFFPPLVSTYVLHFFICPFSRFLFA